MNQYTINKLEDPAFWNALNEFPKKGEAYPAVLNLAGEATMAVAPFSALQTYNDFKNPANALHFTVPATSSPIDTVAYLVTCHGRVFVAFFYAPGQAILAECGYIPLLQRPLGLRIGTGPNAPVNRSFKVLDTILKGDDTPIHIVMTSPRNPELRVSLIEKEGDGKKVLDITMQAPGLAAMTINTVATVD